MIGRKNFAVFGHRLWLHLFDLYKGVEFGEIHMGLVDEIPTNDPGLLKWFLRKKKLKQNKSR